MERPLRTIRGRRDHTEHRPLQLERLEPRLLLSPVLSDSTDPAPTPLHQETVNGAVVSIYDVSGPTDVDPSDVRIVPGRGEGAVAAIVLGSDQPMEGLGITISDASSVGRIVDARRGSRGPVSFIASDASVNLVSLRSGLAGYDLNGASIGGLSFSPDVDGDGATDDALGLYSRGSIGTVLLRGDAGGDVAALGSLSLLRVAGGDISGDARAGTGGIGRVMAAAGWDRGSSSWTGGSIHGAVAAPGDITAVSTTRGDLTGDVYTAGDLQLVRAVRGGIRGDVRVDGTLTTVMAIGGDLSGNVTVGADLRVLKAVNGDVTGDVLVGGDARLLQAVNGSFLDGDSDGMPVSVGGHLNVLSASGWSGGQGNIETDLHAGSARVVQAIGGGLAGDVHTDGDLMVLKSVGGDLSGAVDVGGSLRVLSAVGVRGTGGSITGDINVTGDLRVLKTVRGGVGRDVAVGGELGSLMAIGGGGNLTGTVAAGNGTRLLFATGELTADVEVTGGIGRVTILGGAEGARVEVLSGGLRSMFVRGDVVDSSVMMDGDMIATAVVGDFDNSLLHARSLRRMIVRGRISEDETDGDRDVIHASRDRFFVVERFPRGWVTADPLSWHDFDGLLAYVESDEGEPTMTGWSVEEDTGAPADALTYDASPSLVFEFSEAVYGTPDDLEVTAPGGGSVVPDSVTGWGTATVTVGFDSPLPTDGTYQATLKAGPGAVADITGNPLAAGTDQTVSFSLDTAAPWVTSWQLEQNTGDPNDNLTTDTTPELTFNLSEPVFGTGGDVSTTDPAGDPITPDTVSGWGTDTVTVAFTTPLSSDGGYGVELGAGIADAAGNALEGGAGKSVDFHLDLLPQTVGWELISDTGTAGDRVTADSTPELTFNFTEPVFGNDENVSVVAPDSSSIAPDAVTGWGTSSLALTFSTPLSLDGEYAVSLSGDIQDAQGHGLNDGTGESVSFTLDSTPPTMAAWDLETDTGDPDDALTLDRTPRLIFDFGETVYGRDHYLTVTDPDGDPVADTSVSGWGTDTVTLQVESLLSENGDYTAAVTGQVQDGAGNPLNGGAGASVQFTLDSQAPVLDSWDLVPNTGVPTDSTTNDTTPELVLHFSEPVLGDAADVTVGGGVVPDSVTGWGTDTVTIAFTTPLPDDGGYGVTLDGTATIADRAGNPLNGGADENLAFRIDTTPPSFLGWDLDLDTDDPDDRVTSDDTPVLTFDFSEDVRGQSADIGFIDPDSSPFTGFSFSGSGGTALQVSVTTPLSVEGEYTVTLDGTSTIADVAGNPLGADVTVNFTYQAGAPAGTESVWIEGEDASSTTFNHHSWYEDDAGINKDLMSPGVPEGAAGDWFAHYTSGDNPASATYDFTVTEGGDYTWWVRMNTRKAQYRYALDGGAFQDLDLSLEHETLNLMRPGINDVHYLAWVEAGTFSLDPGDHSVEVEAVVNQEASPRTIGGIDAMNFVNFPWWPAGSLKPGEGPAPGADTWYAFQYGEDPFSAGSIIDMSGLLDETAGEHGWLQRNGADFQFQDGTAAKFWGVDIGPGSIPQTPELMEQQARFYAKHGVNLVRLHPAEGLLGVLQGSGDRYLDPEKLQILDQYFATLKSHGIYMDWSVFYPHVVTPEDGYPSALYNELPDAGAGKSSSGMVNFMDELQQAEWTYLSELMNHVNSETGMAYKNDPALAVVEVHNEDSIFWHSPLNELAADESGSYPNHADQLQQMWMNWLADKYGSDSALQDAWGSGMRSGDSITNDDMDIYGAWQMTARGPDWGVGVVPEEKPRMGDFVQFLAETQRTYFQGRRQNLRDLGWGGIAVGTAWQAGGPAAEAANLWVDDGMDAIDRHAYFGGGEGGHYVTTADRDLDGTPGEVNNGSHVTEPGRHILAGHSYDSDGSPLALFQVEDKPSIMTEWNQNPPNQWRAEAAPLFAFYGMGLQGWDASLHFSSAHPWMESGWPGAGRGPSSYPNETPLYMGQFPALSFAVYNDHIQEGTLAAARRLNTDDLFRGIDPMSQPLPDGGWDAEDNLYAPPEVGAIGRMTFKAGDTLSSADSERVDWSSYWDQSGQTVSSVTGELFWDYGNGVVQVRSDSTQAVVGFAGGGHYDLPGVSVDVNTEFVSLIFTALDNQPVGTSEHILITALAQDKQTGTAYNSDGSQLVELGGPPLLLEPVQASIDFGANAVDAVRAVDVFGMPTTTELDVNGNSVTIDGNYQTYYYEVTRSSGSSTAAGATPSRVPLGRTAALADLREDIFADAAPSRGLSSVGLTGGASPDPLEETLSALALVRADERDLSADAEAPFGRLQSADYLLTPEAEDGALGRVVLASAAAR